MTQTKSFAMVAEDIHRGAGDYKNKNIPDSTGILTMSTSLAFLYRQSQRLTKTKRSMLLGVINTDSGFDETKRRLNFYGLFGKKAQKNIEKSDVADLTAIFVWGANIQYSQQFKIYNMMAAVERSLGDAQATSQNFKQSAQFEAALEQARHLTVLVQCYYDDTFFEVNDDDETIASLSTSYVQFGTGKQPMINSFVHDKDELIEYQPAGTDKAIKFYPVNDEDGGVVSLMTTRQFLKNFGVPDKGYSNLKLLHDGNDENKTFWSVEVGSWTQDNLPVQFIGALPVDVRKQVMAADRVNLSTSIKDDRTIDTIINLGTDQQHPDAQVVFTGFIDTDEAHIRTFVNDKDETIVTLNVRRGTFYTNRILK